MYTRPQDPGSVEPAVFVALVHIIFFSSSSSSSNRSQWFQAGDLDPVKN